MSEHPRRARIDLPTMAGIVVDNQHHEVHAGEHYFVGNYSDQAINEYLDIQIVTPDTASWAHLIFELISEGEITYEIWEGVTIATPGTARTPINNNRNSTNTAGVTVAAIENTSLANANADTAVAAATLLATGKLGSGVRIGGVNRGDEEIILKQNTAYSIRIFFDAACWLNYLLEWYEHTDRY